MLKNVRIRIRVYLCVLLPLIPLIFFAAYFAYNTNKQITETKVLESVAVLTPYINDTIHKIQVERGTSAVYLNSNGSNASILKEKRALSDGAIAALENIVEKFHNAYDGKTLDTVIQARVKGLSEIESYRKSVDNFDYTVKQNVGAYTSQINGLLNILYASTEYATNVAFRKLLASMTASLNVTESLGIERANGSAAIASGSISSQRRALVSRLHGEHLAFIDVFKAQADNTTMSYLDEGIINSTAYKQSNEMRSLFLDPSKEQSFVSNIKPEVWFGLWTTVIKEFISLEDKISADLLSLSKREIKDAESRLWFNVISNVIILITTLLFVWMITQSINVPLHKLTKSMQRLADGNLEDEIPDVGKKHALALMAKTLQVFRKNAQRVERLEEEQRIAEEMAEVEKQRTMDSLAKNFNARIGDIVTAIIESGQKMETTANSMREASENTSKASSVVADAAADADKNVQLVAAAAEELKASSAEISQQVSQTAERAKGASTQASTTSESVNELNGLADNVGEVVSAIKDIAEQTNLLALNATIEAARAGEAGKGFAVVADEVKKLANETAQKTELIDERVMKIQEAIRNSVTAVNEIIGEVKQIDEATSSVASAVEEQNAATGEISRSVTMATQGTQQVAENINEVEMTAAQNSETAEDVLLASEELQQLSKALTGEIESFLNEISSGSKKEVTESSDAEEIAENDSDESVSEDILTAT